MRRQRIFIVLLLLSSHPSLAQSERIGTIDIYGNRELPASLIYTHLPIKEGDSINKKTFKKKDLNEQLVKIPGVKHASVSTICCDSSGNLMLYIGVGENDAGVLKYHTAPSKDTRLPDTVITLYRDFETQIETAVKSNQGGEDDSNGYALFDYAPARNNQLRFLAFATHHLPLLTDVLRNSKYDEHRAAAAFIIAYSPERKKVANQLLYATNDPNDATRNNAVRALGILAAYCSQHPDLNIHIPVSPFIQLVNSIVWTDRNKGASVLMQLTEKRNKAILNDIKQQAWPSLIEMARWKDRGHAGFAFIVLCRIAGVEEKEIYEKNFSVNWNEELNIILAR